MISGFTPDRRPRPGASRSGGPGRRLPAPVGLAWELWNFRSLFPDAGPEELLAVKHRQDALLAREREALARLWSGDQVLLSPGRSFLESRPEISGGIIASLHTGPYQLLAEPWLAAGFDPLILLNAWALPAFRGTVEAMSKRLRHRGRVQWAAVGSRGFMRAVVAAVREGRPVIVYLDGNSGDDGADGTRERGLRYELPGRIVNVRTGLARLACRLECPVHRVNLRWTGDAGVVWSGAPTLNWCRRDDPATAARQLYDWVFGVIAAEPEQWQYWEMLRESSACFASAHLDQRCIPTGMRDEFRAAFDACCERSPDTARLILENDVQVWPGDVLADLSDDRFYPAAGLHDEDLDLLREGSPTLAQVREYHGEAWLRFHGLRLCLLGMARLGG